MKRAWRADGGGTMPWRKTRPSIHDRAPEVVTRDSPCDWKTTVPTAEEADTILFSAPGQAIVVTYERRSRLMLARRARSLKADGAAPGGHLGRTWSAPQMASNERGAARRSSAFALVKTRSIGLT